jgi:hypothetical protein
MHMHVAFDEQKAKGFGLRYVPTPDNLLGHIDHPRIEAAGAIVMANKPGIERTREINDALHAFVNEHPKRLFAIGTVHPADGQEALDEVARIAELGFTMLKLHPNTQDLDVSSDEVAAVVEKAGEVGLPVLFDFSGALNAGNFDEYLQLALGHPETQFVLAHMGLTKFDETVVLSALEQYSWYRDNIWFDLSAIAHVYADSPYESQLRWTIRRIGVERFLFGSDFPYRSPDNAIDDLERLGLTRKEQRKVFYENAASLFGQSQAIGQGHEKANRVVPTPRTPLPSRASAPRPFPGSGSVTWWCSSMEPMDRGATGASGGR